ncbi:unnamed protein product [Phyllotreta striolata]|uniref:Uncharacterized protein n=1 Tax=Phyllotreta striolata TaxID=444603 RepID=A0A9N9XS86_PHYSR|nr:unnamed protein product [Phyllotreta striolata]
MLKNIKTESFYDLCIEESLFLEENVEESLKYLYEHGYRTIAINQSINDDNLGAQKKSKGSNKKVKNSEVPPPIDLSPLIETVDKLNLRGFQIFNRLTITYSNSETFNKFIKSNHYKKYHLIAIIPTTPEAHNYACSSAVEADIYSYNPENKFTARLTRKMYNKIVQHGYYFELQYSHAIEDSTKRKNLIHVSHMYHSTGKSKNVFFSSGAKNLNLIRNPYDILSLGFLFGLNELQCKSCVQHTPQQVIIHSVGRRHGKALFFVENVEETQENDHNDLSNCEPQKKKIKMIVDADVET